MQEVTSVSPSVGGGGQFYDTISAKPETFLLIEENAAETESGDLENYFGQLLEVSHQNPEDELSGRVDGSGDPEPETELTNASIGSPEEGAQDASQPIESVSHQVRPDTHATADQDATKVAKEETNAETGKSGDDKAESAVIRYTWQNLPNESHDPEPDTRTAATSGDTKAGDNSVSGDPEVFTIPIVSTEIPTIAQQIITELQNYELQVILDKNDLFKYCVSG